MVGRSVNVKIVASMADHSSTRKKAIHGTPGWKYCREVQSSSANGEATAAFNERHTSCTDVRSRPHSQPTSTTRKRSAPAQKNHMERPASHHDISNAVR